MTHDYTRHGTITLFAALDAMKGKLITRTEEHHTHVEWLRFLKQIDRETPKELDVHLIQDNYATHEHPKVKAWLNRHPRFKPHIRLLGQKTIASTKPRATYQQWIDDNYPAPQASIRCEMSCYMQMGPEQERRGHDNALWNRDIKAAGPDARRASLPAAAAILAGRIRPIRPADPRHPADPAARHRTLRPRLGCSVRQGAGIYAG
jgi:hypothetical protein